MGNIATSRAPAEYSGNGGPGTFEITTLKAGPILLHTAVEVASREARALTAGAMNSTQSASALAEMTFSCSFAARVPSEMAASRVNGSEMSVHSETSIADTLLPMAP